MILQRQWDSDIRSVREWKKAQGRDERIPESSGCQPETGQKEEASG